MALSGYVSIQLLAYLPWPEADHLRMRIDAAASLGDLATWFEHDFGKPLYISDGYRSFAEQVAMKALKGKFAATPGYSNHGWGTAGDFASRINIDGSAEHRWMERNGPRFGWINPYWAVDYNPGNGQHEPWHWEFHPELNTHPGPYRAVSTPVVPVHEEDIMASLADLQNTLAPLVRAIGEVSQRVNADRKIPAVYRLEGGAAAWLVHEGGVGREHLTGAMHAEMGGPRILNVKVNNPIWALPVLGFSAGELYRRVGDTTFAAYMLSGDGLRHVGAPEYAALKAPLLVDLPSAHPLWSLPIV